MISKRQVWLRAILILTIVLFYVPVSADDYYWIGGSGNWSDINHWSQTSGGTVLHIQIPTSSDDVFFDGNSFSGPNQTVTVNTENAICKSMDWTGALNNPSFTSSADNNLQIYGSIKFTPQMSQNFQGTFTFEATDAGNTIQSYGHTFLNHLKFDGIGGEWTLVDDLSSEGNIFLINGSLITGGVEVTCQNFNSSESNVRNLNIDNSVLYIQSSAFFEGVDLSLSALNSLIILQGPFTSTNGDTLDFYNIRFTGGSVLSSTNVYTRFNKVHFLAQGNIQGSCLTDTLIVDYLNGYVGGAVTVNHAEFHTVNAIITGQNNIGYAIADSNCTINGSNVVNKAVVKNTGSVEGSNFINEINIQDTGIIKESNTIVKLRISSTGYIMGTNTIENAYLNNDGFLEGDNEFDTLTFTAGCRYFIEHNSIQTINNLWNVQGSCQFPIFIKSDYNGVPATIQKTYGDIDGDYLSLRDLHVTGAGYFEAAHSVDLGNNDGWTIETSLAKDLYWVNGAGNWDDQGHWSESSGGTSGACLPTEIDNVYFDANSFSNPGAAVINVKTAVCNNMDWIGSIANSSLTGADTNYLKIYGSLKFTPSMDNMFGGEVHFEATNPDQFIDAAGNWFNNNIRVQGRNGTWLLEDQIKITDTLFFEDGGFTTNGFNIEMGQFYATDTTHRKLDLGSDSITVVGLNTFHPDTAWRLNGQNLELNADSSVITVVSDDQVFENFNGDYMVFNNLNFKGNGSTLLNSAYCNFNLVEFEMSHGLIMEDCTIDTAIFYGPAGTIVSNDTIKTVIFYGANSMIEGNHIVEIAYYYEEGELTGSSKVDTALFYNRGLISGANEIDTTIIWGQALIDGENNIRTGTLKERGLLSGNNTFNDLGFTYSKVYELGHGDTLKIVDNLFANGRCTGPVFLLSDSYAEEAYIEKMNGNIEVDYANIRDLEAVGPEIPFIATNSIDMGGNTNWEISEPESKALYWVGNSGNWSDSLHWAPVSGGEPGYCIPTPIDDVYFDENSFSEQSSVTVDVNLAACHSMDWAGALFDPILKDSEECSLYIYGSLRFIPAMEQNFMGNITFSTNEKNHTITTAAHQFNSNVFFDGRSGSWKLMDTLKVAIGISHVRGSLSTGGNFIQSQSFVSQSDFTRSLFLDTSAVEVGVGWPSGFWQVKTDSLFMDADSSLIICHNGQVKSLGNGYDEKLVYNDIALHGISSLVNEDVYGYYDDVIHFGTGNVKGNCSIDTLVMHGQGNVSDSDSIYFSHFLSTGSLSGGQHVVRTAIFEETGTISGNCKVQTALFNASGLVTGNNVIDTTIFYQNGSIQVANTFNSKVLIYGNGNITGSNTIQKDLIIHGTANIFEENLIHNALLLDWGYLGGPNNFDILTFTPGKTYTLTANTVQTVHDTFNIRGNNCFPITLKSSSNQHVQAGITMPEGEVVGDFIVMKDIAASGNAVFYAGGHSDNIVNNTGWIWDNAPGYIFGLGADTAFLCEGESIILSTENFNGNENTTYEWFDGSTGPSFTVNEPGEYSLMVYYSDDCAVPGSIYVEGLPAPFLDLGPDRDICDGTALELSGQNEYASYLWNTGSTGDTIHVNHSGSYWLEVTNDVGCSTIDDINLTVIPAPAVDLGPDMILHNGDIVELNAGYPEGSHVWSTGDTTQTIEAQGVEGGIEYWVEVEYAGCSSKDVIIIDEYPYCAVGVPTAFSPNGDGINDTLYFFGSGIQTFDFKLFNRYGEMVFETDNPAKGWDGNFHGIEQEQEVYLYYLKAICFDGILTERKGNITLMR
ncbi:MAG: gliding motility-associated C-terminal domain-containing protein [Bacteroidetes bacterium]|nr:gliding motility-associated C-terminal domain-containing protein [Bacteroidota bacterium]